MKKILFLAMFTFASFSLVAAQSDDYQQNEFFAGYSLNRFVENGSASGNANGFNAAYVYNFNRYIGAKADFSAHFQRDSTTFLGTTFTSRSDVTVTWAACKSKTTTKIQRSSHLPTLWLAAVHCGSPAAAAASIAAAPGPTLRWLSAAVWISKPPTASRCA